jgi:hypothetical protein
MWGFLGLMGYYCKFIQNYGLVARPLTQLLKKEAFTSNGEAEQAFIALKQALVGGGDLRCSCPTLMIPSLSTVMLQAIGSTLFCIRTAGRLPSTADPSPCSMPSWLHMREAQCCVPLALVPLGMAICGVHRPFRTKIPVGSAPLHHTATYMGEQTFWV